tara:strand:- start:42 stop:188 length:147 start_codon:yes stop_codon:yes gene_type:complete
MELQVPHQEDGFLEVVVEYQLFPVLLVLQVEQVVVEMVVIMLLEAQEQ